MQVSAKQIQHAIFGIVFVSVFTNAHAGEIVENLKVGGTYLTSRIDANVDTLASSWCTLHIKGGIQGSSMQQCVNEDVPTPPTTDCPGGVFIVDASNGIGIGRGVRTFSSGVDQLFVELTERYLCVGVNAQGPFFKESYDRGVIIGGSGKFAEASGTYEFTYSGTILYGDDNANPPQYFGSITGTGTFVINTPD